MTRQAASLLSEVRTLIPPLAEHMHKGQAGRIAVVGGSHDYCGAPYFSAMASMRLGADMSHIICEPGAGDVIKTYSPDLIVHRLFKEQKPMQQIREEVKGIYGRLHSVCVGPGLGRDEHMQSCGRVAIELAREMDKWIVIDADGLWLVQNDPDVIKGCKRAVLTPNVVEFARLCDKLGIDNSKPESDEAIRALAKALGGPTILQKGRIDRICNGGEVLECVEPGGLKRCGGQGDFLSGFVTTFLAWANIYEKGEALDPGVQKGGEGKGEEIPSERLPLLAAYGGAVMARRCSHEGFKRMGRAMLANDLIDEVGRAYARLFGEPQSAL